MKIMNELHLTENQVHGILTDRPEMCELSFTMLINRLGRKYKHNNNYSTLHECTEEINNFLNKYQHAMAKDYAFLMDAYAEELLAA